MKHVLLFSVVFLSAFVAIYFFLVSCSSPQAAPAADTKQYQKSEALSSTKTALASGASESMSPKAAQPTAPESQNKAATAPAVPKATKAPVTGVAASKEMSAKEVYPQLVARASQWASDAVLVGLSVPYRVGVDPVNNGKSTSITSHFYSASKQQTWVFTYYQGQILAAGSPMLDKLSLALPNWAAEWKVDSPQAAEIAAREGISAVRAMHLNVNRERWAKKQVPENCLAFWEVEGNDGSRAYINASTSEVYVRQR